MKTTKIAFSFTYDVVTPESAEEGDTDEAGFCDSDGAPTLLVKENGRHLDVDLRKAPPDIAWERAGDLRTVVRAARDLGCVETGDPWQSGADISERMPKAQFTAYGHGEANWRTGASMSYAFHVSGVTLSTAKRIARLLRSKR